MHSKQRKDNCKRNSCHNIMASLKREMVDELNNYPFGRENEMSVKSLYTFFCNNLYLGQWELARACIQELHEQGTLLQVNIRDLLRDVAENPYGFSLGSESIKSPHHLSWLALKEYETIDSSSGKKVIVKLRKDVEFRLLLVESAQHAEHQVIQELYSYHREALHGDVAGGAVVPFLSHHCQVFLQQLLLQDPALGHALLLALQVPGQDIYHRNNTLLQALHLKCLNVLLETLNSKSKESPAEYQCYERTKKRFYDLFSLFNPEISMVKDLQLSKFFQDVCSLILIKESGILEMHVVYSCLVGRQDMFLLEEFCLIEQEVRLSTYRESHGVCGVSSTISALSQFPLRHHAWRDLYLLCLKQHKHFLDLIMESAIDLIRRSEFAELGTMLDREEFEALRPLVVLVGWDQCRDSEAIKALLNTLHTSQGAGSGGGLLDRACTRLAYQVDLIQWCLDKASDMVESCGGFPVSPQRAAVLFHGIETHSALHMLHLVTPLSMLPIDDVFDMLHHVPSVHTTGNKMLGRKSKSVRFAVDEEDKPSLPAHDGVSMEREADIAIYRSYCALKCFMEALHFCADTSNWHSFMQATRKASSANLTNRTHSYSTRKSFTRDNSKLSRENSFLGSFSQDLSRCDSQFQHQMSVTSEDLAEVNSQMESFQKVYDVNVTQKLREGRDHLTRLYPLVYRVETIENVFGLLFATNEDIQEGALSAVSDSGEEGLVESRGNSLPGSRENLSSVTSSVYDQENQESVKSLDIADDDTFLWSSPNQTHQTTEQQDSSKSKELPKSTVDTKIPSFQKHLPQGITETAYGIYSISKAELKDVPSSSTGIEGKKNSGNTSGQSNTSVASTYKIGFISNEFFVRDILSCLKECLLDLSAAKFSLQGNQSGSAEGSTMGKVREEKLAEHMRLSVEAGSLQSRITGLTQYISEASWRYQLVSHDWIPQQVGKVAIDIHRLKESPSEEEIDLIPYEEDSKKKKKRKRKTTNQQGIESSYSTGESESHIDITDDSSASSSARRRPRRRTTRAQDLMAYGLQKAKSGIITKMLAPRDVLLHMCLKHGKYAQAEQVVKMFRMDGDQVAAEVMFAEQFAQAIRKLQTLDTKAKMSRATSTSSSAGKLGLLKTSLSSIANVAAAGVASVSVSSTIDQVLSLSTLPGFSGQDLHHIDVSSSPLAAHINDSLLPAMIVLDLACAASKSWQSSLSLLEMATNRLPGSKPPTPNIDTLPEFPDAKTAVPSVVGVRNFVDVAMQLVKLGSSPEGAGESLEKYYKRSLHAALQTGTLPLRMTNVRNYATMMTELEKELKRVDRAMHEVKKKETRQFLQGSKVTPSEKPIIRGAVKHLMMRLSKHAPRHGLTSHMLRGLLEPRERSGNYVKAMYDHVKALTTMLHQYTNQDKDLGNTEYFRMLDEGPTQILGKLIFINMIAPARLEEIAMKLHVSLPQIIVNGCCPCVPVRQPHPQPLGGIKEVNGRKVLNHSDGWMGSVQHPEHLVRGLLTKLVQIMKDHCERDNPMGVMTVEVAEQVVHDVRVRELVAETQQLQYVNLQLLTSREDRLCFYSNLLNLLTVHTVLQHVQDKLHQVRSRWQHSYSTSRSRSSSVGSTSVVDVSSLVAPPSEEDWVFMQNRVAYHVGQLGLVSLLELKHFIIRGGLPPSDSGKGLLDSRWHGCDKLDPWHQYGPPPEPRLLFVMSEGHISSPPIQVLSPEMVVSQLRMAMREYLQASIGVNLHTPPHSPQALIPQLLVWHQADFASSSAFSHRYEGLLTFVLSHIHEPLESELRTLLDSFQASSSFSGKAKLPQVHVVPYCSDFCYTFDFVQYRNSQPIHVQTHKRRNSLQDHRLRSLSSGSGETEDPVCLRQTSRPDTAMFSLTPVTLDYLDSHDTLVATLAALVTSQKRDHVELDTGNSQVDDHVTSDVDLQKYRYEKLKMEFPEIQRHVIHQVLPLEVTKRPEILESADNVMTLTCSEMRQDVRVCLLASPSSPQYYQAVQQHIKALVGKKQWEAIICLIDGIPHITKQTNSDLYNLCDFAMCCAALDDKSSSGSSHVNDTENWRYLLQVRDAHTKTRAILGTLRQWSVDVAVSLLQACKGLSLADQMLANAVKTRLGEMLVYQRVTECAKTIQVRASMHQGPKVDISLNESTSSDGISMETGLTNQMLEKLCRWQGVVAESQDNPNHVLEVLLQSHDFTTARRWANIHQVEPYYTQLIEERYISYHLEKENPNFTEAFQVLEKLHDEDRGVCLSVCENLLTSLNNKRNTLYVAQYMLQHLVADISDRRRGQLQLLCMGCQALLCLPESIRGEYDHLVEAPVYIIEQLLLNMKIEIVGGIISRLRHDFECGRCEGFDLAACDALLVKYATKALEFPVLQPNLADVPSRSQSRMSVMSAGSMTSQLTSLSAVSAQTSHLQKRLSVPTSLTAWESGQKRMSRVESAGTILTQKATSASARHQNIPIQPTNQSSKRPSSIPGGASPRHGSAPRGASPGQGSLVRGMSPGTVKAGSTKMGFVMPAVPPMREQWVPDSAAIVCMVCKVERFSMFNRRHHCRRCGRVVCSSCSTRTTIIQGTSAKTCDDCYSQIFRPKEIEDESRLQRLRMSGASVSPVVAGKSTSEEGAVEVDGALVGLCTEYQYILTLDEDYNDAIREDFYYDQAPSTSLCLSMLGLHSDPQQCGQVILNLCDDVSHLLQSPAPGIRNPEVDYSLVISIVKLLLFHAKMKLLTTADNTGVAQCDSYLGRIDLLKLLVAANCNYVPSIQQLTKMDSLRRLRDKLIEDERLALAMEVSTKCGIDPAGVWAAWGMNCLRAGDYHTAREKFSRVLKAPMDRNLHQHVSKLLTDIIEALETALPPGATPAEGLLAPLKSTKDLLAEPLQRWGEESGLDDAQMQECLYYLKLYGSHLSLVTFYWKHGLLGNAIHYIIEKKCSSEVFVEGLLVPSLGAGRLVKVQEAMTAVDPSLQKWAEYLTATCRYLNSHKLMHTLYHIQIYMKDYLRAAMTCITYFYQRGALGYADLFQRIQHLLSAKQHLEAYLDARQWGSVLRPGGGHRGSSWAGGSVPESSLRMIMTPGEVNKYVTTINLQIEVTKFLQRYLDNLDTAMNTQHKSATGGATYHGSGHVTPDRQDSAPPTLFGSTRTKVDVVRLVLLSGNNVNDGFGLAFRIIQDFKLDSTQIYVKVGRQFCQLQRYNSVRQLLGCVKDSGLCTNETFDEVIGASIKVITEDASETKEAENLIKMIRSDANRISAYILCGKLKSAYLIAVKTNRVGDVRRIADTAERIGQVAVKSICDKWLQQKQQTS